jgi:hypothetical protein
MIPVIKLYLVGCEEMISRVNKEQKMNELLDRGVSLQEAKEIMEARRRQEAEMDDWAVRQDRALRRRPANVRTAIKRG